MYPKRNIFGRLFHAISGKFVLFGILLLICCLLGFQNAPVVISSSEIDATPRLAIISAFQPEEDAFLSVVQGAKRYQVNGRTVTMGKLGGRNVVIFLSGTSMVNAAMNTQAVLDHFHITGIVFSGVAGGVNPSLHIGDVVVPQAWAEYQEQVFARETFDHSWDVGYHSRQYGNYGMMFPQAARITRVGSPDQESEQFWFAADPNLLKIARQAAQQVQLDRCPTLGPCLAQLPRVIVGGRGVSGATFVDNAAYRQWVWNTFQADALDMESAAVAHVAYTSGVPFIAFRSLSDLAGGGPGSNEIPMFLMVAANNSSKLVIEFLKLSAESGITGE